MSETNTPMQDPFFEIYKKGSERTIHYAGLIGYSIGTLKSIAMSTTDEKAKDYCETAIKYLEEQFSNHNPTNPF
jgi:hypothetical protein